MAKARLIAALGILAAFGVGTVAGRLSQPEPRSFAECLLVNARQAHANGAIGAIAQSCEALYPESAAEFGSAVSEYMHKDARDDNQSR